MVRSDILVKINNRGKIQIVFISMECDEKSFKIHRETGQRGSKMIQHALIEKFEGKAKRTLEEQALLEYASARKKYLNKGYKNTLDISDKLFTEISDAEIKDFLGQVTTDTNDIPKPMLALQDTKMSIKSYNKEWYCSRKLDGVRCMMFLKDGKICTASRGGKNYDASTEHIRTSPEIIKFFKANPTAMLDGELYHHGISLQQLSGIARLKVFNNRCYILQYWIYDYVSPEKFADRYIKLMQWKKEYPEMTIIDHEILTGWTDIKTEHDKYCSEGFEGLVMRNGKKEYGSDKRSALYMVKVKQYQDAEFEVLDYVEGFRPIDDICFICKTEDGKTFKAKPVGDKAIKQYYVDNIDSLIGKKGTVKFFGWSDDGIPTQPTFKNFRETGE